MPWFIYALTLYAVGFGAALWAMWIEQGIWLDGLQHVDRDVVVSRAGTAAGLFQRWRYVLRKYSVAALIEAAWPITLPLTFVIRRFRRGRR